MDKNWQNAFWRGVRNGLPIFFGYLSVAFAYGVHTSEGGLPAWAAVLISMSNFTSAGQVAGTDLILMGGTLIEIAVTIFVINIRYLLMSLSLSQKLDPNMTRLERAILSFGNTDEVFAVAMRQAGAVTAPYLAGLILTPYIGWSAGTLLGATATGLMPALVRSALGIAIYGMFLAIVVPEARASRPVAVVAVSAAALSCLFYFAPWLKNLSSGWAIIICSIVAAGLGATFFPLREAPGGADA